MIDNSGKTALQLLEFRPQEVLPNGTYEATYLMYKQKRTKYGSRYYYQHTFNVNKDDKKILLNIDSGLFLKKGFVPQYNTKLFNIVTALLGKEPQAGETVYLEDQVGKKCKVVIDEKEIRVIRFDEPNIFDQIGVEKKK